MIPCLCYCQGYCLGQEAEIRRCRPSRDSFSESKILPQKGSHLILSGSFPLIFLGVILEVFIRQNQILSRWCAYTPHEAGGSNLCPAGAALVSCVFKLLRLIGNLWPQVTLDVTGLSSFIYVPTGEFAFPVFEAVWMQLELLSHVSTYQTT